MEIIGWVKNYFSIFDSRILMMITVSYGKKAEMRILGSSIFQRNTALRIYTQQINTLRLRKKECSELFFRGSFSLPQIHFIPKLIELFFQHFHLFFYFRRNVLPNAINLRRINILNDERIIINREVKISQE